MYNYYLGVIYMKKTILIIVLVLSLFSAAVSAKNNTSHD